MQPSLVHMVTAATTPFHPYAAALNNSSSCGNDYRQGGNGWSQSLFLSLISIFNPSISYRGLLTGSSHCSPAGLCVFVWVIVGLRLWTHGVTDSRHGGRACSRAHLCEGVQEPYLLHHYLLYWVNPLSQAPVQLLTCLPLWLCHRCMPRRSPTPSPCRWTPPQKHTLMHMWALLTTCGHTTSVELFICELVVASLVPNETALFIVQCDSSGLTIRLIMSHWDIDGCLSILVFTKEPVPLLWVAVDTNIAC